MLELTAGRPNLPLLCLLVGFKLQLPMGRHRGGVDGLCHLWDLRALSITSTHTGSALQCTAAPELSLKLYTRILSSARSPGWPCATCAGMNAGHRAQQGHRPLSPLSAHGARHRVGLQQCNGMCGEPFLFTQGLQPWASSGCCSRKWSAGATRMEGFKSEIVSSCPSQGSRCWGKTWEAAKAQLWGEREGRREPEGVGATHAATPAMPTPLPAPLIVPKHPGGISRALAAPQPTPSDLLCSPQWQVGVGHPQSRTATLFVQASHSSCKSPFCNKDNFQSL